MRRSSLIAPLIASAALLAASDGHAARVTLTTCGQTVVGSAQLAADLDCSAYAGHALVLDGNLALNGFTLTGNATDPAGYTARSTAPRSVACASRAPGRSSAAPPR